MLEDDLYTVLYIGGDMVCQQGAIGTHTKGVIDAFARSEVVEHVHLAGSGLECFTQGDSLTLHNVPIQVSQTAIGKFIAYRKFSRSLAETAKRIAARVAVDRVIVYHRYSTLTSNRLLKLLR
jgi:hypothetical protein